MADTIRLEVNAETLANRVKGLPGLTKDEVVRGMRQIVGKLEARVIQNIEQRLSGGHSASHPQHIHLADSVVGTVSVGGDLVIGKVEVDPGREVPYARILEQGGVTSAHLIKPVAAGAISFNVATLKGPVKTGGAESDSDLTIQYVRHPGARIQAFRYLLDALQDFRGSVGDDLEAAWRRAIMKSGF